MIRIDIPARFLVHCRYCHEPLNSTGKGIYHRGTAWFKQQTTGNHAAGLNSASMVEWSREWCCVFCMKKLMPKDLFLRKIPNKHLKHHN